MLNIQKQFITFNRTVRSVKPSNIVIHSTGNTSDTAQNNHDYFAGGDRGASADFFVDDTDIIQIIDSDNYYSWQVGDGHGKYGISNANSVGIEMCGTGGGNISDITINNTVELTRYLMNYYNIGIDNVVRHYDASRKSCPYQFEQNNWSRWYDFKNRVANGVITGEWLKGTAPGKEDKWWYKHSDGSYSTSTWEQIEGEWYYFDYQGYMSTGWIYTTADANYYYCYSNGKMAHDIVLWDAWKFDSNGVGTKII